MHVALILQRVLVTVIFDSHTDPSGARAWTAHLEWHLARVLAGLAPMSTDELRDLFGSQFE